MFEFTKERLEQGYTYSQYRSLLDDLILQDKTTGDNHSEEMLGYARLNIQRMNRLDKTVALSDSLTDTLKALRRKQCWVVITEGWCGDASQIVPVLQKMAAVHPEVITLRIFLRDENLDIMDAYLTNGGRAIPKVILVDEETLQEITNWGPRPKEAHDMYWQLRNSGLEYTELSTQLHTWYAKNKTMAIQQEWLELLQPKNV